MEKKEIIVILLCVLIILYFLDIKKENLDSTNISNEAIQNIANLYSDTSGTAIFNNIKTNEIDVSGKIIGNLKGNVTGNMIGNLTGNITGNVTGDVTGNINTKQLCIGNTCINEDDLQRIITPNRRLAGFAFDGWNKTTSLYEGSYELADNYGHNDKRFSYWINDSWNVVFVFRGWKITFYNNADLSKDNNYVEIDNSLTSSDMTTIDNSGNGRYPAVRIRYYAKGSTTPIEDIRITPKSARPANQTNYYFNSDNTVNPSTLFDVPFAFDLDFSDRAGGNGYNLGDAISSYQAVWMGYSNADLDFLKNKKITK